LKKHQQLRLKRLLLRQLLKRHLHQLLKPQRPLLSLHQHLRLNRLQRLHQKNLPSLSAVVGGHLANKPST
jgi:hypothetical protein